MYPEAKMVLTNRDSDSWKRSKSATVEMVRPGQSLLELVLREWTGRILSPGANGSLNREPSRFCQISFSTLTPYTQIPDLSSAQCGTSTAANQAKTSTRTANACMRSIMLIFSTSSPQSDFSSIMSGTAENRCAVPGVIPYLGKRCHSWSRMKRSPSLRIWPPIICTL